MKNHAPSSTAKVVARNIAFVAATERGIVSEESERLNALFIENLSPNGKRFLARLRHRWFQNIFRFYERITIPGLALHQALRKNFIEKSVREAIAEGFAQIIVLGGGFDTLALRLHKEFSQVNFIELDHQATQRIKCEIIERHDLGGDNLTFISTDFTKQNFAEIIENSARFQPKIKTVFVCEGVLMYLERTEVERLFDFIREQNLPQKRFIFTFMERDEKGKINFHNSTFVVNLWLKWEKEPFKWGIKSESLKDWLNARGFSSRAIANEKVFRQKLSAYTERELDNLLIAKGEAVCVCEHF